MNNLQLKDFNTLIEAIGYGSVDASFTVHGSQIMSLEVFGNKTNIYNRSNGDRNNNKQAIDDIVQRILDGLKSNQKGIVSFTLIHDENQNIKTIQWRSKKKKSYRLTKNKE